MRELAFLNPGLRILRLLHNGEERERSERRAEVEKGELAHPVGQHSTKLK